jgi:hypothetical protein
MRLHQRPDATTAPPGPFSDGPLGLEVDGASMKLLVRKRDQALAAAAVVPFEPSDLAERFAACFEDRFVVDIVSVVRRIGPLDCAIEEISGRQLFGVANDDNLLCVNLRRV